MDRISYRSSLNPWSNVVGSNLSVTQHLDIREISDEFDVASYYCWMDGVIVGVEADERRIFRSTRYAPPGRWGWRQWYHRQPISRDQIRRRGTSRLVRTCIQHCKPLLDLSIEA